MQFPQSLLSLFERGGQLVTANARSARDYRQFHGRHQVTQGQHTAWASPQIYDWHSWLMEQWQQLLLTGTESRLLLSRLQEESIWAGIVRKEVEDRSLISPREVARLAQNAWERLASYGGLAKLRNGPWGASGTAGTGPGAIETQEPELFRRWAIEFERRCQRNSWVSASLLPWIVADAINAKNAGVPSEIAWTGFDRITPAEDAVRAALDAAGCRHGNAALNIDAATRRISVSTTAEELEACAAWARDTLRDEPSARIGVLLQNPSDLRAHLDRTFRYTLMPASKGLRGTPEKPLYEFTLGLPLGDVPMIRAALLTLKWMESPIEREQISCLLSTGFFALSEDTTALVTADARFQQEELLPSEMSLDACLARLERYAGSGGEVARWTRALRLARGVMRPLFTAERSCRQWAEAVVAALSEAGWPGTRPQDSVGYQVLDRWQEILEDVASLDFDETRVPYKEFLRRLTAHAQTALFTAESEDAPISISGVLESAGRVYDAVWVLGATDEAWPIHSAPHSMLPLWLQAELGMPRGDAQQDSTFSAAVLERLQQSTTQITFSHARESSVGSQRPSPLLAHLPENDVDVAIKAKSQSLVEPFEDVPAIAWPGGSRTAGGHDVLKMQAACPFQAFAVKRLGAGEQRSTALGLDALQRGTLLHDILDSLWQDARMTSSAGLHARVTDGTLSACVADHVDKFLNRYSNAESAWDEAYLQLERQRLCFLIDSWLMLELDRPPFEVKSVEERKQVDVNGLHLNVRLDRIDTLLSAEHEGERILIDYKTGQVKAAQWTGPRIEEPQLPLYATTGNVERLRDVFFAQLRPGNLCFTGATAESQELVSSNEKTRRLTKTPETFEAIMDGWKQWLGETSQEFQEGVATVDPKKGEKTCERCALGGLCRVAETGRADAQTDDGEDL